MEVGQSFVLESNFSAEWHGPRLRVLQEKYGFQAVEMQCVADGEELVWRFRQRWEAGERHPGHVDEQTYDELRDTLLPGRLPPLGLEGEYFEVDTTDFPNVDVEGLIQHLAQVFKKLKTLEPASQGKHEENPGKEDCK